MSDAKLRALLDALARAPRPLSGEELGSALQVSSRSVRTYVAKLNHDRPLVEATHHGYALTAEGRQAVATASGPDAEHRTLDTPQRRLQYLCRTLTLASEPLDVYALAEELFVSDSTLELDLRRVREVLREHDLVLRRHGDQVWVEGLERSRRRMLRELVQQSGREMVPAWQDLAAEFDRVDMRRLRETVSAIFAASPVELNEYALSDIVLHLAVTIDRVQGGHTLPTFDWATGRHDAEIENVCRELVAVLASDYDAHLPEAEVDSLYAAVAVRAVRARGDALDGVVDPAMAVIVGDIMTWVSSRFLLGPPDPSTLLKLTAHVQNVVARARSGVALAHPLGSAFRHSHPLVHEMALTFAEALESRMGITVASPEVDYLALHMGMQYMTFLEQRDLPTVTLVVPRYYDMDASVTKRVRKALKGKAIIEHTLTSMDADLAAVTSDLVVTCVPVSGATSPVVSVSPLLPVQDVDRIVAAAREERDRNAWRRVKTSLYTLIDPNLYLHVPAVSTKEDALALMCGRLIEQGYVDDRFFDDVIDREDRSATSFGGAFAIPHSMRMDARTTAISVLVSDRGIPWGTSSVRLVLLFALSEEGRRAFRDGLDEITRLLSEPGHVDALLAASDTAEGFLEALNNLLDA